MIFRYLTFVSFPVSFCIRSITTPKSVAKFASAASIQQALVFHLQLVLQPTDSPFKSSKKAANNICSLEQFKISNDIHI
jgi:hypothetical protein